MEGTNRQSVRQHARGAREPGGGGEALFFIDARASISQQFLSPFGPTPTDLTTCDVQPHERHEPWGRVRTSAGSSAPPALTYLVRNESNWTSARAALGSGSTAYHGNTVARLTSAPARVSWDLAYNRSKHQLLGTRTALSTISIAGVLYLERRPGVPRVRDRRVRDEQLLRDRTSRGRSTAAGSNGIQLDRTTVSGFYEEAVLRAFLVGEPQPPA